MKGTILYMVALLLCMVQGQAQQIVTGPVVGGVTHESARIYYRTDLPAALRIEVADNEAYTGSRVINTTTTAASYHTVIADVDGLEPNTRYYYRVFVEGEPFDTVSRFRTFPEPGLPGYYRVAVGSCNYDNFRSGGGATSPDNYMNDVLFGSIRDFDPHVVIHLGDWNYPPSRFGATYNLDPAKRAQSFAFRYEDYNFSRYILPYFPVDYMYDDSYSYNGSAGWTYPVVSTQQLPGGDIRYVLLDVPFDPGIRTGNIQGYFDHFPGYPQVDTSGVHHSFRLGNIEFFIVDTRNSKSPVHAGFRYNEFLNAYEWQPPAGHSTLGPAQREWLLNGLRQSDADWKVIGSSVLFNRKLFDLMDLVLLGQLVDRSLIEYAAAIAYMWPGYPADMFALLDAVRGDSIDNVVILSGDTHSSMMDDGRNSGIPEISSSGWAAGNEGYFNATVDGILEGLGLPVSSRDFLWNGGGTGVGNEYIGDSWVRMEFFYRDSMRACVMDEFDQVVSCMTLPFTGGGDTTSVPTASGAQVYTPWSAFRLLYPNPARDRIRVEFHEDYLPGTSAEIRLLEATGREVGRFPLPQGTTGREFAIAHLPRGTYLVQVIDGDLLETRRFVKR